MAYSWIVYGIVFFIIAQTMLGAIYFTDGDPITGAISAVIVVLLIGALIKEVR